MVSETLNGWWQLATKWFVLKNANMKAVVCKLFALAIVLSMMWSYKILYCACNSTSLASALVRSSLGICKASDSCFVWGKWESVTCFSASLSAAWSAARIVFSCFAMSILSCFAFALNFLTWLYNYVEQRRHTGQIQSNSSCRLVTFSLRIVSSFSVFCFLAWQWISWRQTLVESKHSCLY